MNLFNFFQVFIILFLISLFAIIILRKNVIMIIICIEMMLLAVNLLLMLFSVYLDDFVGQIFALLVLTVAAAESAIGLAILVIHYKLRGVISVDYINFLKG
jgi:NADH-quinone oxidoreductase subunit K